ncbi:hypothetical protein [Streptomyces sp. WG7]|uniref:hypothetical protein n=1 Tax=Streptomyces sp. WG7 TaxID=3417650 RepID=UPI003CF79A8B
MTAIESGAMLAAQVIDEYRSKEPDMAAARIRSVLTRSAARHLVGVRCCDSCAQACDSACRARAQHRGARLAPAPHVPFR